MGTPAGREGGQSHSQTPRAHGGQQGEGIVLFPDFFVHMEVTWLSESKSLHSKVM